MSRWTRTNALGLRWICPVERKALLVVRVIAIAIQRHGRVGIILAKIDRHGEFDPQQSFAIIRILNLIAEICLS